MSTSTETFNWPNDMDYFDAVFYKWSDTEEGTLFWVELDGSDWNIQAWRYGTTSTWKKFGPLPGKPSGIAAL